MKQTGQGILPPSEIYFSSPSPRAKKLFYTLLCAGHFFCKKGYCVKRDSYDSFLILHVIEGSFSFMNSSNTLCHAKKGETVIIDCYNPHCYFTSDYLESVWIHITGPDLRALYNDIILNCNGVVRTKTPEEIKNSLFTLSNGIKPENMLSESRISFEIYKLLLALSEPRSITPKVFGEHEGAIVKVKDYVSSHINEDITVKQLADIAHMSVTHFSRVFKQCSGFSPYDYVLSTRLNKAKELLLKTDMSVTEITYLTGFNSEANFVYCFTKNEGISPGKFRKNSF